VCPNWHIPVRSNDRLGNGLDDGARFPGLGNGKGPGPVWQEGACNAREDKAAQNRHRQGILGDILMSPTIRNPKDDVLHLVIYSATGLESFGLGVRREIV
jgi:hypothetical protein